MCCTLPRINRLIFENNNSQVFVDRAGVLLRTCEAQLRDEAQRLEAGQARSQFGSFFPITAACGGKGLGKGVPGLPIPPVQGPGVAAASGPPERVPQPAAADHTAHLVSENPKGSGWVNKGPEDTIHTSAKKKPPLPPPPLAPPSDLAVKTEPLEGSPSVNKEPLQDVQEIEEPPTPKDKKVKHKKRDKEKSRRKRSTSESQEKRHPKRRRSPSPAQASGSRRRETGGDRSPSVGGKEKKARGEVSPRSGGEGRELTPKPPNYPPKGKGKGWRGPIPFSGHQRWSTGKNKGIVKRAKQERFNQRKDDRRRY